PGPKGRTWAEAKDPTCSFNQIKELFETFSSKFCRLNRFFNSLKSAVYFAEKFLFQHFKCKSAVKIQNSLYISDFHENEMHICS
ncbi:hypothetical protein, partial [Paenibacillus apiarius]|uniref:hypothetical protein n=1 Tax=Paenibacillus apiarius TaxID=46240 RepID=UPI003B3B2C08